MDPLTPLRPMSEHHIPHRERLLRRLDDIGRSLAARPTALALLGLGSVGRELNRLDDYSDLDFFVIVESGHKPAYLADLSWLGAAHPLAYAFHNSADGHKFLFADGIYGEMAVFAPEELATVGYAPGRFVWRREGVPESWAAPPVWPPRRERVEAEWLLGEALTNLYVGLCRYRRGEKLSAFRFIQQYAVDRVLDLVAGAEGADDPGGDTFDKPRRFEQRYPAVAPELPAMMPGYDRSPESAAAILAWLEASYPVDPVMKRAIGDLLAS